MNTLKRKCDLCNAIFDVPPSAPHKRFCSAEHRDEYHQQRRREALKVLDRVEEIQKAKGQESDQRRD